ncbi:MAG TPA: glycoside hydrolase family 2 [Phycisphaerae bacterium]|nr:glycoside hydrolase family 2 [Phycisphaerae bacterium]
MAERRISLNGTWSLHYCPDDENAPCRPADLDRPDLPEIPAAVPGNVELDLIAAGKLEPPEVGNNIYGLRDLEAYQWWYSRPFAPPQIPEGCRIELVFEGLDCIASVWLNRRQVGEGDNMLVAQRFDVTDALRRGGANELAVKIAPAALEGRRHRPDPVEHAAGLNWESLSVRKAPHMYGWDIMPRAVSAGIWRDVYLEVLPPTRWRSVYWATPRTDPAARTASVLLNWDFMTDRPDVDPLRIRVTLARDGRIALRDERPVVGTHGSRQFTVEDADLWWPRGYGRPALYDATVELLDGEGELVDTHTCRIGLRTVVLERTDATLPDEPGEFVFRVNGEKVFCKGTNWVPLDAFHSRDAAHRDRTFEMLVDLHCNMVRCWGGNVYEDHAFFDLCDEHGVMVWQDFAMACAVYPQTDAFAAAIRREAEAVVNKLRNHPSLVLWAGNNEVDQAYGWAGLALDPNTDRLSRAVLPEVVRRCDPYRCYLPSSPYISPDVHRRGDQSLCPEQHLWGPRDDFKGPFYVESPAHFVSEIGYHGCPDRRSLEQFLEPDSLWPWQDNEQWLTHCVRAHPEAHGCDYRVPLMARQIAVLFGAVPDNLDDFILASQISQAEALKFFIERWRSGKWRRTGILWWNLRDGWPILSDAIVDYYSRRKLAYAYVQRVQADVCVICREPERGRCEVVAVNGTLGDAAGTAWVRDADGGSILRETDFAAAANGVSSIGRVPEAPSPAMWLIEWRCGGGSTHRNHYLAGPRPFRLEDYRRWLDAMEIPLDIGPVRA